jgi:hypothetical protein
VDKHRIAALAQKQRFLVVGVASSQQRSSLFFTEV